MRSRRWPGCWNASVKSKGNLRKSISRTAIPSNAPNRPRNHPLAGQSERPQKRRLQNHLHPDPLPAQNTRTTRNPARVVASSEKSVFSQPAYSRTDTHIRAEKFGDISRAVQRKAFAGLPRLLLRLPVNDSIPNHKRSLSEYRASRYCARLPTAPAETGLQSLLPIASFPPRRCQRRCCDSDSLPLGRGVVASCKRPGLPALPGKQKTALGEDGFLFRWLEGR